MTSLTIAIPTFNRNKLLKENLIYINKVLEINKKLDIRVMVIDNGDSSEIIKDYPMIKYIKNNFNIGANGSIFKIIENVKSEYLWIIGDDDYLNPDLFQKVIELIYQMNPDWILLSQGNSTLEVSEYSNINDLINSNINVQDLIFMSINIYKTIIFKNNLNKISDNNNLHAPHFVGVAYSNDLKKIIHYRLNPFLKIGVEDNIKNMWAPITLWTSSFFDFIFKQDSNMPYKYRKIFLKKIRKDWLTNKNLVWSIYLLGEIKGIDKYLIHKKIKSYIYLIDGKIKGYLTLQILIISLFFSKYIKNVITIKDSLSFKNKLY